MTAIVESHQESEQYPGKSVTRILRFGAATLELVRRDPIATIGGLVFFLIILVCAVAPWLSPFDPNKQDSANRLLLPSASHLLGTDDFGRDLLSRILYGGRTTLLASILSVFVAVVIGGLVGTTSAYFGGWIEAMAMRIMDVLLSFPLVLLAIVLATTLGPGLVNLIVALGVSQVPLFARLARSLTLSVRNREWVEAVVCLGAGDSRILFRHIVPNIVVPLVVQAAASTAFAVLYVSSLNFLGLGVQPPMADWGSMVSDFRRYVFDRPYLPLYPGLAITISVVSLNLFADGLVERLDPMSKKAVR